ncbi:MAG: metallophosphoesterase [Blautia sp.]|nr:metallophosphoesterase [Blautia sp.]
MALYAIGDLHLSIMREKTAFLFRRKHYELYKPMDVFDPVWRNHVDRIERIWKRRIRLEDTVMITGDHSWCKNLEEGEKDFEFIQALPGRKILLRGNHDMFWDVGKTDRLNQRFKGSLSFLQNNFFSYEDYALVGTKGICFEGKDSWEHFVKIRDREEERLRSSFEKASQEGYRKFIMFLHYPPTSIGEQESCFTRMAAEYGAEQVIYSHCHGQKRYYDSFHGEVEGIEYRLVSSDFLKFQPLRLL